MSEYISKQEAIEAFSDMSDGMPITHGDVISDTTAVNVIKSIPSADVRENKHAYWKKRTYIGNHKTVTMNVCSECDKEFGWDIETGISISDNNFCPNCGADMREPKGEKGD